MLEWGAPPRDRLWNEANGLLSNEMIGHANRGFDLVEPWVVFAGFLSLVVVFAGAVSEIGIKCALMQFSSNKSG